MYPCEEYGFRGDYFRDIEEHQQNHKKMGQIKLHKDLEDNSNEDEDWTKSKEGEMLLQEDSEN